MTSLSTPLNGPDTDSRQQHDRSALSPMRRPRTRSPATAQRLQIKNRRRRYLELHPEYFDSTSLELADPLAYDRLIRRFQSTEEREREGRKKGYAGLLEADLWRQEAKSAPHIAPVDNGDEGENAVEHGNECVEDELADAEPPETKEQGAMRWRSIMEQRFMEGSDADFEYESVDDRDEFDDRALEDREEEERWFDQEEAAWVDDRLEGQAGVEHERIEKQSLSGQTGVQDF